MLLDIADMDSNNTSAVRGFALIPALTAVVCNAFNFTVNNSDRRKQERQKGAG